MKGYKNAFAAGAISIMLAVTGCYAPTDTGNTANNTRRVLTDNYGSRNIVRNSRNINRRATANYNKGRVAANRRAPGINGVNQYGSSAVTTNRSRNLTTRGNAARSGLVNTDSFGRRESLKRINPSPYSRSFLSPRSNNTGVDRTVGTKNIGAGATRRSINTTGSPFGDYNKDRAYSAGTARTSGNIGADNTIVKKSFTEGVAQTRSQGTETAKTSVPSKKAESNHTAATAPVKTTKSTAHSGNTTANAAKTPAKVTEVNKPAATAATGINANAVQSSNRKPSIYSANLSQSGSGLNNAKTTSLQNGRSHSLNGASSTLTNNTSKGYRGGMTFEGPAYNEKHTFTGRSRSITSPASKSRTLGSVYDIDNRAHNRLGGSVNRQGNYPNRASNLDSRTRTNNTSAGYSRFTRNRGANDLVYNNMILNNDMASRSYRNDNLTIGSTYRNADLRNDYYNSNNYYGYNSIYGMNGVPRGTYTGINGGINTGTGR